MDEKENQQKENSSSQTDIAKIKIIDKTGERKDRENLVDYKTINGSGTISLYKDSLLPNLYRVTPSAYPLTEKEIFDLLSLLNSKNEEQVFLEILKSYAFSAYVPAIISCKSLLEGLIDKVCQDKNIDLFDVEENKPKGLIKKIKELNLGKELKDFAFFSDFMSNKATHEIFEEYGRNFDKIKATILLSCTLLIIKEINQKYGKSTTI